MARRLLVTYLTITALTLAIVVIPLGRIFAEREHDRLTFDVERDAQAVASLVEDALEAGTSPSIDDVLARYGSTGGRIVVVDRDGIGVADSDAIDGPRRDFSTRPEIAAALDGERTSGVRASETLGTDLLYVAVPVASGGTVHGAVRVTYPTSTLDDRVRSTWLRLGLLSVVVLALVAVVGMAFARGVTRPVRDLKDASERLAAGDLDAHVDIADGVPELRSLADTFNATALQLGHLIASQQRFVADASHQLRTPLTALRLRLETMEPHVSDDARPKLDAAIAETNRLARLVHSLLVLARSDAATVSVQPVDVSAAVSTRVDAWTAVARDQGVRLVADCPRGMWVTAVRGAIEQILDNLVSNALDVAPEGSEIRLEVRTDGAFVEVHVVDEGPGMDAASREHAFERFWRPVHAARESGDGFGLGLAIVQQLATQSGGDASLREGHEGRGLDAVVRLPSTAPPVGPDRSTSPASATENVYPTLTSH